MLQKLLILSHKKEVLSKLNTCVKLSQVHSQYTPLTASRAINIKF
ncbi:hypothetical protein CAXC1_180046 [Candidatus Xenohaliotis californiensis]|uniref:Uncharacterized protein n=1 Tax=Candidatus Xenohaliotis californiensis TaxID=84677 RepID=A0ABP0ES32_9RICK|nr:hypothetical protein CAXC1_180046 [Candidatus Xenohaliotis californiensis]